MSQQRAAVTISILEAWHKRAAIFVASLAVSSCVWVVPVSVTSTGLVAGAVDEDTGISSDGRYIAFTSEAALVPSDTNSLADVYRYDALKKSVLLLSATSTGTGGNAASKEPSISADGTRVAFASAATDLGTPSNGKFQILVRDVLAGTTTAASVTASLPISAGDADSSAPALSADGSMVAFATEASNLSSGDTNGVSDIFSFDIGNKKLMPPIVGLAGATPNGPSTEPSINADGSVIAFTSRASNLVSGDGNGFADVFTVSSAGIIKRISAGVLGEGNGPSRQPSIASKANVVSFSSEASNLVRDDSNGVSDIFVHVPGLENRRISPMSGSGFAEPSTAPSISSDGNRLAFLTGGPNIGQPPGTIAVVADLIADSIYALSAPASLTLSKPAKPATHASISADGDYVSFNSIAPFSVSDRNNVSDVYTKFSYLTRVWPWALSPGRVKAGTVSKVTISGDDFRVSGVAPTISAQGASAITFSDVRVVDARTITATMSVPASVANNNYRLWIKTPGGGPGDASGSTQSCACLTVAAADPAADLVDMASSLGLPGADGGSAGLLVDDLNDDGFEDILFMRHEPTPELLFLGNGHTLTRTAVMSLADRHECDSADVNNDGRTDLYCAVGAWKGSGEGRNNLWIQRADGSYVDEAANWGVTDPYGRGRDVAFLHANKDALPDLFVSNWGPRTDNHVSANRLFLNSKGQSFSPAPEYGVDGELPSLCALSADFDNDGDDDLLVCGIDHVRMYANQNGAGFLDVSAANGFTQVMQDASFADIDGDGDLDIAFATSTSFEIHRLNKGIDDGVVFSRKVQSGKSVAFGDINGDGKPDAYFVQRGCRTDSEQNLPDIVAVNAGATFSVLNPPEMSRGCGDAVSPFDLEGDGTDGFLVGNGRDRPGPLQYLVLPKKLDH